MRGLAAISVLMFHFVCVSNNFLGSKLLIQVFSFAKYGVQVFFLISAYVLTLSLQKSNYKIRNLFTFLWKRVIRIEPPYLISIFCSVILLLTKSWFIDNSNVVIPTMNQILLHIGYLIPFSNYKWINIVYWTLAIEFQFYFLLAFLFPFLKGKKIQAFLILNTLSFSIYITKFYCQIELFSWIPIFVSGIIIALDSKNVEINYLSIFSLLIANSLIFVFHGFAILLFVLFSQVILLRNEEMKSEILYFLGKISYSIYLIHTIIGFLLINIGFNLFDNIILRSFYFIFTVLVTIMFSFFYNKFFELPFIKIASKFKYN